MIVDASAILAILLEEPETPDFLSKMKRSETLRMSSVNWLEVMVRVDRKQSKRLEVATDQLLARLGIRIENATPEQAHLAREAYRTYGKGSGHKAGLNFGDCFAYALAKAFDEPLLFKGNDFSHTDIRVVRF